MTTPTSPFFKSITLNGESEPEVTPAEVFEVAVTKRTAGIELIDVRRPDEFTGPLGHATGAQLVTLETEFASWVERADPNKTYVFLCRSGQRSTRTTGIARQRGLKAFNMEGGMMAWNAQGLPVER